MEEYIGKGLTAEDILAAAEFYRKDVYTINQILDKLCEGNSFVSIANVVENGELISVMPMSAYEAAEINYDAIENPYVVVDSKELSLITVQAQSHKLYI